MELQGKDEPALLLQGRTPDGASVIGLGLHKVSVVALQQQKHAATVVVSGTYHTHHKLIALAPVATAAAAAAIAAGTPASSWFWWMSWCAWVTAYAWNTSQSGAPDLHWVLGPVFVAAGHPHAAGLCGD